MKRIVPLLLALACSAAAGQTALKMKMFPGEWPVP